MTRKEEILRKFQQMDDTQINNLVEEGKEQTNAEWRKLIGQYQRTDYLRFKPELILELAKPFTSAQQMRNYEGENQEQIRQAGQLLYQKGFERPEWFEDINFQTPEECIKEAKSAGNVKFDELSWALRQKLAKHFESREMHKLLPNIQWDREYRNDDDFIKILSQFKTASEMRNTNMEMKNLLSRVMGDKGVKYPKAYKLAESMKTGKTGSPRGKRGKYEQRTPAIEQYDLEGKLLHTYPTWTDVIEAGFKRSSVTGAIRGTDGHNRHKGYIWRHSNN